MSEDVETIHEKDSPRKHGALGFVVFFIFIVMSLLVAYSFLRDSKTND